MAKYTNPVVLDAALDKISTATRLVVCSAQPANFAGIAAVTLAVKTMTGGQFTKANGDVSGRKVTVAAQADLPITATGDGNHLALDDGTTLLHVTTVTAQTLTSGNTVSTPAFDVEFLAVTP